MLPRVPRNVNVIVRQEPADVRDRLLEARSSFAKQSAPCRPDRAGSIEDREIEEAAIRQAECQVSVSLLSEMMAPTAACDRSVM